MLVTLIYLLYNRYLYNKGKNMGTIYKLNFSNGDFYVGKTSLRLGSRILQHINTRGKGSPLLQDAFATQEYLGFDVVEDNIPEDILGITEAYYIKKLKPTLNTLPGGESLQGLNHPRCKYTEAELREVANLIISTEFSYMEISRKTGVLLSTVRDIAFQRTHAWLIEIVTPEALEKAAAARKKTYTLYDINNEPYEFTSITDFSRKHGFNAAAVWASQTGVNQKGWSREPKPIFTVASKDLTLTGPRILISKQLERLGLSRQNISAIFTTSSSAKGFKRVK